MNQHREHIIGVLQLFASKSEQFELWWARDQKSYIPEVLLGRWEEFYWSDDPGFRKVFSEKELQNLNCFYDFVLARMNALPKDKFETLMTDIYWDSVCRFADEILETFTQDVAVETKHGT